MKSFSPSISTGHKSLNIRNSFKLPKSVDLMLSVEVVIKVTEQVTANSWKISNAQTVKNRTNSNSGYYPVYILTLKKFTEAATMCYHKTCN